MDIRHAFSFELYSFANEILNLLSIEGVLGAEAENLMRERDQT